MHFRFTIRLMLVLVALAAFIGGALRWATVLRERALRYQSRADINDGFSKIYSIQANLSFTSAETREAARALADWYTNRREIYKAATARPWRRVAEIEVPRALADRFENRRRLDMENLVRRRPPDVKAFSRTFDEWAVKQREKAEEEAEGERLRRNAARVKLPRID